MADIDLYADVDDDLLLGDADDKPADMEGNNLNTSTEMKSGQDEGGIKEEDLYDDVLHPTTETDATEDKDCEAGNKVEDLTSASKASDDVAMSTAVKSKSTLAVATTSPGVVVHLNRRYQVYIGNLTWWTTDKDVDEVLKSVGITDVAEIKFFDNRTTGQSKGFCNVTLGSEESFRSIQQKLANTDLHDRRVVVSNATRAALNHFESQSQTRPEAANANRSSNVGASGLTLNSSTVGAGSKSYTPQPSNVLRPPPLMSLRMPPPTPPSASVASLMRGPPVGPLASLTSRPPPPMSMISTATAGLIGPTLNTHHRAAMPPTLGARRSVVDSFSSSGPAPHVNPAFLASVPPPSIQPSMVSSLVASLPPAALPSVSLSEAEFEEIMSRNRTVSSSAIARAVQDAAAGQFASAIETLVTAISLIKQSKVASDDRCRILISSLQDTLSGIENRSYASAARYTSSSSSSSSHHHNGGISHGSHHGESESRYHRRRSPSPRYYRDRSPPSRDRYSSRSSSRRDDDYDLAATLASRRDSGKSSRRYSPYEDRHRRSRSRSRSPPPPSSSSHGGIVSSSRSSSSRVY